MDRRCLRYKMLREIRDSPAAEIVRWAGFDRNPLLNVRERSLSFVPSLGPAREPGLFLQQSFTVLPAIEHAGWPKYPAHRADLRSRARPA